MIDQATSNARISRIFFDASCTDGLRQILTDTPGLVVETDPGAADLLIFGSDAVAYVGASPLYRAYRRKCVCITESDIPTFRLPGLYAANMNSLLTSGRTRTISYFISERERGNPEIRRLIGQTLPKQYLYSFMGGTNSWPRRWLFGSIKSQSDTLIEPSDSYNHWNPQPGDAQRRVEQMRRYALVMAQSKFTLCPRGCGLSSYRIFESMSLGVVPVIISDAWRPIEGIDWSFAIFVPERRIRQIDRIVRSHEGEWEQRGQKGREIYTRLLAPGVVGGLVRDRMIEVAAGYSPAREYAMSSLAVLRGAGREVYWSGYDALKLATLWGFHVTGRNVPIRLNQPIEVQLKRTGALTGDRNV